FGYSMGLTRSGALFYGVESRGTELYTASLDFQSGKLQSAPVLQTIGDPARPLWSPDGKSLAYLTGIYGVGNAYSFLNVRSIGTGQTRAIRPQLRTMYGDYAWSPDGRFVAMSGYGYQPDGSYSGGIYKVDVQTGVTEPIEIGPHFSDQAQWSPDGKKMFFMHYGSQQSQGAFLVERDLATGIQRNLRRIEFPGSEPLHFQFSLSPDGRSIMHCFYDKAGIKQGRLLTGPADGSEPRELIQFRGSPGPWTPDGRYVIIRKTLSEDGEGEFWQVPVDGGEARKIELANPRART